MNVVKTDYLRRKTGWHRYLQISSTRSANSGPQHYLQLYVTIEVETISSSTRDALHFHSLECTSFD
ncbi:hypothetical protein VPHD148_0260 [Vibrio phage D148]